MRRIGASLSCLVIVRLLSVSAHAALVDMHDGTIYDTDARLSWLKDAGAGGEKTWREAAAWAANLNAGDGFAGLTGWRLPKDDPSCGLQGDCTSSEPGHLFFIELRNHTELRNRAPFTNLHADYYWTDTRCEHRTDASAFFFDRGSEDCFSKSDTAFAWAVRSGARSAKN
jgi:hypothetical protein